MAHIEQAIKEAVEKGGYHKGHSPEISTNNEGVWMSFFAAPFTSTFHQSDIFLDPLFWQAYWRARSARENGKLGSADESTIKKAALQTNLDLINYLHSGKSAESFFSTLV